VKSEVIALGILVLVICAALATPSATNGIAALVTTIVAKADKGDAAYFAPHMDSHYRGRETDLVAMIRRSGMATNYVRRCTLNANGTGRLDYHYLERGCHFQIDLSKTNDTWRIKRIWFCR
jgi:hypothetical protein